MVVKSVFTVISTKTTIIFRFSMQKVFQNFEYKRGEPIFQVWVGKKRGGPKFFQNPRGGTKALHTMKYVGKVSSF